MGSVAKSSMRSGKVALLIFPCLTLSLLADEPRAPLPVVGIATKESESLRQGGHNSIALSHQQSVIQCMELVRDALSRKDYVAALPLLEQVLSEPDSFVPVEGSIELGAHEAVRRAAQQLPSEIRQRLNDSRKVAARVAWDQARTRGTNDVVAFLAKFGDQSQGIDAWWWLGFQERDQQRFQMAASAFARIRQHPAASQAQRVTALMAQVDALRAGSYGLEILALQAELSASEAIQTVEVAGQSRTAREWLSTVVSELQTAANDGSTSPITINQMRLRLPALQPQWKHAFEPPLGAVLENREQKQREQGVRPQQILRPMCVGNLVIVRTLEAIQAFELLTGELRWSIRNTDYRQTWIEDDGHQSKATEWAQRRSSADSIFGRMVTDERRLFVIQDSLGSDKQQGAPLVPPGGRIGARFNKLCSYWLDSGSLAFEIGGDLAAAANRFAGQVFLGCPLVKDGFLYVVAQRETSIQLLALDAESGSLRWSLDLGTTLLPIADDLQRSHVACPIVWHDGLLLCSTSAGALVAVDPLLKMPIWGYRYPATTIAVGDLQRGPNHHDAFNGHEPWWDFWREPFVAVYSSTAQASAHAKEAMATEPASVLVFASPESDELHAIRLPDGKPLWKARRDEGTIVAGIDQTRVIVLEGDAVRCHDVLTGKRVWRTPVAEISGPGVLRGSFLVAEAQAGGTTLLDLSTGHVLASPATAETPLGALTETESGWVSYSRRALMRLPQLGDVLSDLEQQLRGDPSDESLRTRAASLDLQAGASTAALRRLKGLDSASARELRHAALVDMLTSHATNRSPEERAEVIQQLLALSDDDERKFTSAVAISRVNLEAGNLVAAVTAALDGLTTDPDRNDGLLKVDSVYVRRDRLLLGLIDAAYRKSKPQERQALDALFDLRWNAARKARDRSAVQLLVQQWRGLDWSRKLVVQDDERALRKRGLAEVELLLLDAAGSTDRSVAIQALEQLAQRFDRAAATNDAVAVRRRILQERAFSDVTAPAGDGAQRITSRENYQKAAGQLRTKPLWSDAVPVAAAPREEKSQAVYPLVPMHPEPGSLAERLDICIDRNGKEVLFRGESFFQVGQDDDHEHDFELPSSPVVSPYRNSVGYMLREAWGLGRIVVVLVGSELFAIRPLDENGEPNAQFIWSSPIELQGSPYDTRIVTSWSGPNEGQQIVIDQLNRQIGRVGPVRAGYLCYQRGIKLISAETDTGRTLWERLDLPAEATILGDEQYVLIWHANGTLEVLSAIDGRLLEQRETAWLPENAIHQRDCYAWMVQRGSESRIEMVDLRTGRTIWTRSDTIDTRIAVLDPETLAIATPDGKLHFVAARLGIELCEPLAVNTDSLAGLAAWYDSEKWFIALMRPLHESSPWKSVKPTDSYRRKFVTGTLVGVDRQQLKILWQRDVVDEPISLDQSRAAPVLVHAWKVPVRANSGSSDGILLITDKRTGKILIERRREDLTPNFLLNPDAQQGILEVKLPREMIRLNYSSRPEE